jgi:KDO2-lipid IV(A) lauroyltransferase
MRRSRDLRGDLVENTQRITDAIERVVREHPEQWHWLMRRWKEYYPQLYE